MRYRMHPDDVPHWPKDLKPYVHDAHQITPLAAAALLKRTKEAAADKAELEHLTAIVAACKERNFIDENGEVRKVSGTLFVSEDGAVLGQGATVSEIMCDDLGRMTTGIGCFVGVSGDDWDHGPIKKLWANHDNAKAALAGRNGNA